ncbi:MAG: hypothetical protein B6D55_07690 [Candidatus Omnitrophica bacterium 4484_70.2]|nr:MAG: hypothetical protein B6D55_07690 [Candidatus Omnitrophica bacterium 4484_70.2]
MEIFRGGRYLAFTDDDSNLIRYFGIPRYLFKRMGKNIFSVLVSFFSLDKRKFLKSYMDLLLNIGMIFEYVKGRKINCQKCPR